MNYSEKKLKFNGEIFIEKFLILPFQNQIIGAFNEG